MITGARLVSLDGVELLTFGDDPIRLQALTLGYPDVRATVSPIPGRDGEYDTTTYHGASAITLDLSIQDSDVIGRDVWMDRIRGYCSPRYRGWLHLTSTDWPVERRILVRGEQAPVTMNQPGLLKLSIGFRAPSGRYESTVEQSLTLFPTTGGEGGVSWPLTPPFTFAAGNVTGAVLVTNGGTVDALPYIDLYGFCTDPIIKNLTTGQQIGFTGLTIPAGDFLRVDMAEQLALLGNDRGQSRYSLLDFTTSSWWGLAPGSSLIAFVPGNPGASCQAVIRFRDTTI